MTAKRLPALLFLLPVLCLALALAACAENEEEKLTPDRDCGEIIAGVLSINTCGLADHISDLAEFLVDDTTKVGAGFKDKYPGREYTMHKTYDQGSMTWTITIHKTRGDSLVLPYGRAHRVYTIKYFNALNEPQKYYVTDSDTARAASFKIAWGRGYHYTRRISDVIDSLSCNFTVTNAHRDVVTLNGYYYREGLDNISGWNKVRDADFAMEMTLQDFHAPRGYQPTLYQYLSGAVTGSIDAVVTFTSGTPYGETTLSRDFDLTVGLGKGNLSIGDKDYTADLFLGELED